MGAPARASRWAAAAGDLQRERILGEILVAGSRDGMLTAAHDVSDGGFAMTIVEMALRAGIGARLWLPDGIDPFVQLFSESAGRAVVVVPRSEELRFSEMCGAAACPLIGSGWSIPNSAPTPDTPRARRCCSSVTTSPSPSMNYGQRMNARCRLCSRERGSVGGPGSVGLARAPGRASTPAR